MVIQKYIEKLCNQEVEASVRKHFEAYRLTLDERVKKSFQRYLAVEYVDKIVDMYAPEPFRMFVREKIQTVLKAVRIQ